VLGFGAGGFFPTVFPALDFCAAGLEAFALLVEVGEALGLAPFPCDLEFFFSAMPVDLTCSGDYSTFGLSPWDASRFRLVSKCGTIPAVRHIPAFKGFLCSRFYS